MEIHLFFSPNKMREILQIWMANRAKEKSIEFWKC